jgi:protein-tyrosine-phosphatase/DNA-binding HxlR family transcriptional regulator
MSTVEGVRSRSPGTTPGNDEPFARRVAVHGALADANRLRIVDELAVSDRSPGELAELVAIAANLTAHHLETLELAGLIRRIRSSGDGRRRYVSLTPLGATFAAGGGRDVDAADVVFVCTHNSARSQLAAALWRSVTGRRATSAGTHPARRVHPAALAAAERAGLGMARTRPRAFDPTTGSHIITVCDRAHEELAPSGGTTWHWSIPDPADPAPSVSFDDVVDELGWRISTVHRRQDSPREDVGT